MGKQKIRNESTSQAVVFSTFFSLVARMLSFVQAMIVSYYFGATKSTDFLFFCVSFTLLLPGLFSNINQSVIVPNAMKLREKKSEEESQRFILYFYIIYILLGVVICAVVSTIPEEFVALTSKFNRADIEENIMIVKLIIPTFFFILTNSYILNVFDSYRYFTFPMILDMLKSILTILFIILLGKEYGVGSMAAGILIAYIIQFIVLNIFLVRLPGFSFKPKRYVLDSTLRKNIMYVVISQVANILSQYVVIYLISGLEEGVYTALSYSDRLFNIFVLVFTGQITTVLGINIIEMYTKQQFEKLNLEYQKYLKITMTIILPVCFVMAVQSQLIISILFERGHFDAASVELTSIFFRYSILIVPLLMLDRLIVRLIIAKQIMSLSFVWNVVCKVLSAAAVFTIVNYIDYRYYGLGLLIVQVVYILLINMFMIKREFGFIEVNKSLLYILLSTCICAVLSFGMNFLIPGSNIQGIFPRIAYLCAYSLLMIGSYFIIGFATFNRETVLLILKCFGRILSRREKVSLSQTN